MANQAQNRPDRAQESFEALLDCLIFFILKSSSLKGTDGPETRAYNALANMAFTVLQETV